MTKLLLHTLIVLIAGNICYAQNKDKRAIDSLATLIKENYAGYADKVKGDDFNALLNRVKQQRNKDTFALLSQLTSFFKDQHLMLLDYNISKQKIDTQQCIKDNKSMQHYFAGKKLKDKYEGYWLSEFNYCVIAIKKVKSNPVTYYGYVMETKIKAIPGYCILKMTQQRDGSYYTDYIEENLDYRAFLHARFKNNNTLWLNSVGGKWRRIPDYRKGILKSLTTFSYRPAFSIIDDKTILLKMHSFGSQNIKKFDSIIKANAIVIGKASTLIIDIRNNAGGVIDNYLPLFPYIYTNPILHCGSYTFYGDLYINDYEETIKYYINKRDTVNAKIYIAYLDSVKAKKGQFDYAPPDTLAKNMPILSMPENVAIIINNNCLSAAELMLLNFKQSNKVKIFGERTGGAVDYLNAVDVPFFSGRYNLQLATVKRQVTAAQPSYDQRGIPPDVEIADDVIDWIDFVKKHYNEHK
jgi:hypothetical protein